jgi:hypothetical protein
VNITKIRSHFLNLLILINKVKPVARSLRNHLTLTNRKMTLRKMNNSLHKIKHRISN